MRDQLPLGQPGPARTIHGNGIYSSSSVTRWASATLKLDQVLDAATAAIQHRFSYFNVSIFLIDKMSSDENKVVLRSVAGERAVPIQRGYRQAIGSGIVGRVAETGQILLVDDISQEPQDQSPVPTGPAGSELAVPIMKTINSEQVIGVLDVQDTEQGAFSQEDVKILKALADQLATTIENAELYEETQRHLDELTVLYQLARQINTSLNVQEVLDSIVWSLKQAMECRGCSIALLDPVDNALEIRSAAGVESKWKQDFKLRLGEGIAGRVALEGTSSYVPDVLEANEFIFFDTSVRSLLTVPLTLQQRVIGTLTVDSDQPDAFSAADERLLTIAATQAAVAIENARLYASLEQRAQNLAEAYAELKKADRIKDEIVQNVSHELRTPLTFVKSYVELLLDKDTGPLTAEQQAYLEIVVEKTNVVTQLVSNIMALQRAEQMPSSRKPVSLTKLARQAVRGYSTRAKKAGLIITENMPDDSPPVAGDEDKLLQVFDNLLDNAVKFSPDGGQIVVTVEDAGQTVQASVSDQGIGIPKDQQEQIFERFYQIDGSARRRFGGVGLGLAIVKRILEAHEGRVWVESNPGQGSTFYLTIPKYQAPHI
ncbi:MAG: GAF domain-containing sensor histidine kinase [Chloroflexota bacterium]|nr:GAF domain-containing sensor histidine kinase [Chloroflexota bacterium]